MRSVSGRADIVVTGGVDAPLAPGILAGFCLMRILTESWNDMPERGSRPFSKDRDGFVLGEGAWIYVVETEQLGKSPRRADLCRSDGIWHRLATRIIAFVSMNPDIEPARAMELAIRDAGLSVDDIDYVNLHGTSTELNDRIETRAIKHCFKERAAQIPHELNEVDGRSSARRERRLRHQRSSFRDDRNRHSSDVESARHADPECDLDYVPCVPRKARVRYALANCIGFGSKNSALVLGNAARALRSARLQDEIMDDLSRPESEFDAAYRELEVINRWLGGIRAIETVSAARIESFDARCRGRRM